MAARWGRPQQGTLDTLCEWVSAVVSLADPVGQSHQAEQLFLGTAMATAWEVPGMGGGGDGAVDVWPSHQSAQLLVPPTGTKGYLGLSVFPLWPSSS